MGCCPPPKTVAAAVNGGAEGKMGLVSLLETTQVPIEISYMLGMSVVSVHAGVDVGEAAYAVALTHHFRQKTQPLTTNLATKTLYCSTRDTTTKA